MLEHSANPAHTQENDYAHPEGDFSDWLLRIAIVFSLAAIVYAALAGSIFQPVMNELDEHQWARLIIRPSLLWFLMGMMMLGVRTMLWFRYKPVGVNNADQAPSLTVIIPAYNEGSMVEKAIESVIAARYPRERLEIFVVDDGSTDDTWHYITRSALRHPGLITTVRFDKNQGKRAALAQGFRNARGEVIVTIDSDSVIERDALLAMVAPFRNQNVGAVAGKVVAYNRREGLIPRMLHVRFILAFDFLRAVQSTYGTVYCCPGALAAYRTTAVRNVLEAWEQQTFLGAPCTYGEDRALTNFILAQGYDTVYQRNAVVHTLVPPTYSKLCKMYLRWDRSYVREEFRFISNVVWKRPWKARCISLMETSLTNMRWIVFYASFALLILLCWNDPSRIIRLGLVMGLMSGLSMLYYLRSERSWDFVFGIFYSYFAFLTLFWIFPYAVVTVRARSWLTR
jgi:hyaluronan synthase